MIMFRCPKCNTTLKAPEVKAGARTRCPQCRSPVHVPAPSPSAAPRQRLPPRSRPRSKAMWLVMGGVGLFAAMLTGAALLYAVMSLGGWLNSPGAEARAVATGQSPGDPSGTQPAKLPHPAPPPKTPDGAPPKAPAAPPKSPDPAPPKAPGPRPDSVNGGSQMVDDLKVTTLSLPAKGLLSCMLWADANGSAFLVLNSETGVLRRISFPDLKVTKQKELDGKFTWMSHSAEGLLLSSPDSEKIWVVDPATLEVKTKIEVPKLRRAVSAPALNWAVACDQSWYQHQKLYMVDLVKKTAVRCAVPQGNVPGKINAGVPLWEKDPVQIAGAAASVAFPDGTIGRARLAQGNLVGVDSPAVTPDGAFVYTQGYNLFHSIYDKQPAKLYGVPTLFRFAVKNGMLAYQDFDHARISDRDGGGMGEITFSPDSRLVCLPGQPSGGSALPIYPTGNFQKHVCTLDPGQASRAVGFDLKAGYTYTQDAGHELMILSPHGLKKKQYSLERPTQVFGPVCNRWGEVLVPGYSRPWQEGDPAGVVQQYLVHPGGKLVLLTAAAVYAVEVPKKE